MAASRTTGTAAARERILAATLVSLARYGVAKTTLEDVAKEAGCARATVYRYFGGKQQLLDAVVTHESARVLAAVDAAAATEPTLEDALVAMGVTAAHAVLEHDALQFVLAHEPELVLPWITFDGADRFLALDGRGARADVRPLRARRRVGSGRAVVHPHPSRAPRGRGQPRDHDRRARGARARPRLRRSRRFALDVPTQPGVVPWQRTKR